MSNRGRYSRTWWIVILLIIGLGAGATRLSAADTGQAASEATKNTTDPGVEAGKDDAGYAERQKALQEELELLQLFYNTMENVKQNYVKDVSDRELIEAAIRGMLSKLDQYSSYIPPTDLDRFRSDVESEFGGIGIRVTSEHGYLEVISPLVGTPAYRAGVMAGDRIVEIDGKPTEGMTIDDAVVHLKGRIGTTVRVTVVHPGESQGQPLTLKRETVRVATVLGDRRNDDDSWNFFADDERKIGYIRLTAFGRHTAEELRVALEELKTQDVKGLVLDLRFNPGGLLSSAIEVSDLFVDDGTIVSTEGRNSPKREWTAHKAGTYDGFPMAILVNHFSASASEIVSACLQDHERAIVVGERSWGKGSVQNIIELEDGRSALKLTTASYQRPSGKNIHRFTDAAESDEWGVKPNEGYEVKMNRAQLRALDAHRRQLDIVHRPKTTEDKPEQTEPEFTDPQLQKALAYLNEQLAPVSNSADADKQAAAKEDSAKEDSAKEDSAQK